MGCRPHLSGVQCPLHCAALHNHIDSSLTWLMENVPLGHRQRQKPENATSADLWLDVGCKLPFPGLDLCVTQSSIITRPVCQLCHVCESWRPNSPQAGRKSVSPRRLQSQRLQKYQTQHFGFFWISVCLGFSISFDPNWKINTSINK